MHRGPHALGLRGLEATPGAGEGRGGEERLRGEHNTRQRGKASTQTHLLHPGPVLQSGVRQHIHSLEASYRGPGRGEYFVEKAPEKGQGARQKVLEAGPADLAGVVRALTQRVQVQRGFLQQGHGAQGG